jgi:hypothetical protein
MLIYVSNEVGLWRGLPPRLADVLAPALPAVTGEILHAIGRQVPEYARPLEGAFGQAVRTGVQQALRGFVNLIRDPDHADDGGRQVYISLGRAELHAGRTLDALQAAYRVGARVAWRHFAKVSHEAGVDQETAALLAEAIFAYIDELSADSVEGYAQAQSELAGERERQQAKLVAALLSGAAETDAITLSTVVGWPLPRSAAALACPPGRLAGLARRLSPEVVAAQFDGLGCVIVPDAEGPGRRELLRAAAHRRGAAVGPEVPLMQLPLSWELATAALDLAETEELIVADEHLASLLVNNQAPIIERIGARRLAPLDELTPLSGQRMTATALAYVQHVGNAAAMARTLKVHPQTARYRIARLRELLGDQLDDPQARFELEAALRARAAGEPRAARSTDEPDA